MNITADNQHLQAVIGSELYPWSLLSFSLLWVSSFVSSSEIEDRSEFTPRRS